ncbi:hypothetical protein DESUT3_20900 [Desulfuromonas versatilis]|uniref:Tetratricopeptide repeat protein n=1 Tax=Desulfuromonas versatilis TaxID=2802975 RepID=A0ABM8HWC5_9BACT|nr:tetratricopeptide repeat protein [Desulfuromonas versatilis]BCR05021.1 hypothetical protein DESUT3_20900 [Desulfuromonas versatilis]
MSFLKRLFGGGDPVAQVRRALDQKRWADALAIGEGVNLAALDEERNKELAGLLEQAGDGLAELNLGEGEACLRGGDQVRAAEHFDLALQQARSQSLKSAVTAARERLGSTTAAAAVRTPPASPAAHGSCADCRPASATQEQLEDQDDLDTETRLELILASYPQELAERCHELSGTFLEAFLLAHEGREPEAMERFEQVAMGNRDDLFYFERGSLLGRLGQVDQACSDLERAAQLNPGHPLVLETLITLELTAGRDASAEARLRQLLDQGQSGGFCQAALADLSARRGNQEACLEHALQAIGAGWNDPNTLLLAASLLEKSNRLSEAEALLSRISGKGCGAGAGNVYLAEFWLRRGQNLDKALEAFKRALREDPQNPRWLLRVGQAYTARGWKKEGLPLVKKALTSPDLPGVLRTEAQTLLEQQG